MDTEMASDDQQRFIETNSKTQLIPTNCVIQIFSFLSRDELEKARLVNWTWNSVITTTNQRHFQKRQIHAVEISSNSEYSAKVYYKDNIKQVSFKKYFSFCDLLTVEDHAVFKITGQKHYRYPCSHTFRGEVKINEHFKFSARTHAFRGKYCNNRKLRIYNKKVAYKSKIFTPPLDFYLRLQWLLKNAAVKHLVFVDFAFTELFVEKFEEYFGCNYEVEKLFIHNCSLKHISCQTFHHFIGNVVKAKEYHFELLKNALPNHINDVVLLSPNLLQANIVIASGASPRRVRNHALGAFGGGLIHFNVTQAGFKEYTKQRRNLHTEKLGTVFGIQYSLLNDQQVIADYTQEYKYEGGPHLFKFVLFGQFKFIASDSGLEIIPPAPVPVVQNAEDPNEFLGNILEDFVEQEEVEIGEFTESTRKQNLKLVKYSVYENNQLKDPRTVDIFKSKKPTVS